MRSPICSAPGATPAGAPVCDWSRYLHRAQLQPFSHSNSNATPWADITPRTLLNRPGRAGPSLALPGVGGWGVGEGGGGGGGGARGAVPVEPAAGGAGGLALRAKARPAHA